MEIDSFEVFIDKNKNRSSELIKLNRFQLDSLQNIVSGMRNTFMEECLSHALYRCTITCQDNDVHLIISGSNEEGRMKELYVICDLDAGDILTKGGISFSSNKKIYDCILNMILGIMKLPFTVGLIQFPFEGNFKEGVITDYKYELGTKFICIKDSMNFDFFRE